MTKRRICGHTNSGQPITDEDVEKLAAEAEAGYQIEKLNVRRNKRGRPTIGSCYRAGGEEARRPRLRPSYEAVGWRLRGCGMLTG